MRRHHVARNAEGPQFGVRPRAARVEGRQTAAVARTGREEEAHGGRRGEDERVVGGGIDRERARHEADERPADRAAAPVLDRHGNFLLKRLRTRHEHAPAAPLAKLWPTVRRRRPHDEEPRTRLARKVPYRAERHRPHLFARPARVEDERARRLARPAFTDERPCLVLQDARRHEEDARREIAFPTWWLRDRVRRRRRPGAAGRVDGEAGGFAAPGEQQPRPRRSGGERAHARAHEEGNPQRRQGVRLLREAPKEARVAALQPDNAPSLPRLVADEARDIGLLHRMRAAALANGNHVRCGRRRRDQFFSQEVVEENRVGTGEVATTGDRAEPRVADARRDEPHGLHERPAHRLEARVARAEDDGEIPLRLGRRQLGKRNRNERHALRAVGVEAVQSRQRHQHRVERSRNELAEARVDCAANRAQRRLGERRRRVGAPPLA